MSITRRVFLRNGALAVVGTAAVPSFLTRAALSSVQPTGRPKRLVVIFQRGAADGLNIVVPHGEQRVLRNAAEHQYSHARTSSISTACLVCIPQCLRCSRSGRRGISPSCTRLALPTRRARTSTPRISWNRELPA